MLIIDTYTKLIPSSRWQHLLRKEKAGAGGHVQRELQLHVNLLHFKRFEAITAKYYLLQLDVRTQVPIIYIFSTLFWCIKFSIITKKRMEE